MVELPTDHLTYGDRMTGTNARPVGDDLKSFSISIIVTDST